MSATLRVRVIPRAKKSEIAGWRDDALIVRLTAPPVEGAANRLLVRFLARELSLRPADISIMSGRTVRDKLLHLEGLSEEELRRRLPGV